MVSDTSTAATGKDYGPREGRPTARLDPQDASSDGASTAFRRPGRIAVAAPRFPGWTSPRTRAFVVFMYYNIRGSWLQIAPSALRHGIKEGDVIHAIEFALLEFPLDSEPPHRVLRLVPHSAGNLLGVVTLMNRDGDVTAIHAMRMRRKYMEPLGGGTLG